MSEANRTKFEVQKIIRDILLEGLENTGMQPTSGSGKKEWDVLEFAQASFTNADKIVLIDFVCADRVGFQGFDYKAENGQANATRTDDWLEEQTWNIHTLLKMKPSESTESALTCIDAANMLISWMNGPGAMKMLSKKIGVLRIDQSRIFVYNDDSELYQRRAVFPLKIQVAKEFSTGIEKSAGWRSGIYPV